MKHQFYHADSNGTIGCDLTADAIVSIFDDMKLWTPVSIYSHDHPIHSIFCGVNFGDRQTRTQYFHGNNRATQLVTGLIETLQWFTMQIRPAPITALFEKNVFGRTAVEVAFL